MDYMDPMSSVLKKADKLNLSLSLPHLMSLLSYLKSSWSYHVQNMDSENSYFDIRPLTIFQTKIKIEIEMR